MSDNTDERMERAERIRELRESGGETDTEQDAEAPSDQPAGGGEQLSTTNASGGLELPDQAQIEEALDDAGGSAAAAEPADEAGLGGTARGQTATTATQTRTRVLEFELGEELYCIEIAGIEEIVKRETVTRVPNTPEYVEGVVDLRGQITTILDAKGLLGMEADGNEELIVVFAPEAYEEYGAVGWIVDEVRQVRPITEEQLRESPSDDDYVKGVVDREDADELVVWIKPEQAMQETIADQDDD